MRIFISALLIILLNLQSSISQEVELTDGCKEAYQSIIALKFNDARRILDQEKEALPDNLYIPYLENYLDFLTIFIDEDEEQFNRLEENKSSRVDQIRKLDDSSAFRNYMLGNIHLQWAVARLKFREYFTAALEINKAYRLLEKNEERFPDFVPNKISLGVLHVMIGMVPKKYHWLLNLISMEGSVEQGREELAYVIRQSDSVKEYAYLKDETLFYLAFIDLNIQPDPERLEFLMQELKKKSNDNLLLSYLLANMMMRTGNNDEAIDVLTAAKNIPGTFPFYFLDYLTGECYLRRLDTGAADRSYRLFLSKFKGKNYKGDAYRKQGWISLFRQDTATYFQEMQNVIKFGNEDIDVDKEAMKEAEAETVPHIELLKSRLLFDGGYYSKADSLLQTINTSGIDRPQLVEIEYRKGRIDHKTEHIEMAKAHYKMVLELGSELPKYYAGNAALMLGEIYESERDWKLARFYYETCLDLDFDEYENSIHSKAQAGLARLDDE